MSFPTRLENTVPVVHVIYVFSLSGLKYHQQRNSPKKHKTNKQKKNLFKSALSFVWF